MNVRELCIRVPMYKSTYRIFSQIGTTSSINKNLECQVVEHIYIITHFKMELVVEFFTFAANAKRLAKDHTNLKLGSLDSYR